MKSSDLICIAILIACIGGWIANVAKLIGMLGGEASAMFIARVAGLFLAPLGAFLGYF